MDGTANSASLEHLSSESLTRAGTHSQTPTRGHAHNLVYPGERGMFFQRGSSLAFFGLPLIIGGGRIVATSSVSLGTGSHSPGRGESGSRA